MVTSDPLFRCFKCNEELAFDVKIGRRDMCPNCYAYLHCCKNCQFWDPSVHNECLENRAEFIRDREEGNFCLYFTFKASEEGNVSEAEAAKAKLASLFGGAPSAKRAAPQTADDAKAKLEALFKKN
jgi:hypothetical protein